MRPHPPVFCPKTRSPTPPPPSDCAQLRRCPGRVHLVRRPQEPRAAEQKAQAAEHFGAEGQYLSAAKKLLDTKHEAFQQVTALRSQIVSY